MASSVNIVPSLGFGAQYLQVGPSSGYDAIDDRRKSHPFVTSEGVLTAGAYKVSQRAAGANLSVDVAANVAAANGASALVMGDSVVGQGLYTVVAHTAVINVDIAAANATNPRNDLVILEVKDDAHDVGGLNVPRVRVVTGTATAGAALTDLPGVNGTPALPASSLLLAVVNLPALDTTVSDSQVSDRRTLAAQGIGGGKSIVATAEARTNAAYGLLTTPDVVRNIVLPTDGLICVAFQATWQEGIAGVARAAIFLGSNQLRIGKTGSGTGLQQASTTAAGITGVDTPLASYGGGLFSVKPRNAQSDVTTGQVVGAIDDFVISASVDIDGTVTTAAGDLGGGGPCCIFAAAGTYDISVQFKSSSGTVTVKQRKLWVWTMPFG